ncbi:MAG: DUF2000 domain-containing protein [bacterium]|nr:DUF2000 domain-containing protein [bacterium]
MNQNEDLKIVIVVSASLGIGMATNRAAVLATGLAAHVPDMIGENLTTKDGSVLLGFTQIPIPILSLKSELSFHELVKKSKELECQSLVYLTRAQGLRSYQEYKDSIAQTTDADLDIDGIAIWGDKKLVNKIVGSLPSLR